MSVTTPGPAVVPLGGCSLGGQTGTPRLPPPPLPRYTFGQVPEEWSPDGFVRAIDALTRASFYVATSGPQATGAALNKEGNMVQIISESGIANTELSGLMTTRDARLLSVGTMMRCLMVKVVKLRQNSVIRLMLGAATSPDRIALLERVRHAQEGRLHYVEAEDIEACQKLLAKLGPLCVALQEGKSLPRLTSASTLAPPASDVDVEHGCAAANRAESTAPGQPVLAGSDQPASLGPAPTAWPIGTTAAPPPPEQFDDAANHGDGTVDPDQEWNAHRAEQAVANPAALAAQMPAATAVTGRTPKPAASGVSIKDAGTWSDVIPWSDVIRPSPTSSATPQISSLESMLAADFDPAELWRLARILVDSNFTPSTAAWKALELRGVVTESYAQLDLETKVVLAKRIEMFVDQEWDHEAVDKELIDFIDYIRNNPGGVYKDDMTQHRTMMMRAQMTSGISTMAKTMVNTYTVHRFLSVRWVRTVPLLRGEEIGPPTLLRSPSTVEGSRIRANAFVYDNEHGLGICGSSNRQRSELDMRANRPARLMARPMVNEMGELIVNDPSAKVGNWYAVDIDKIMTEFVMLNAQQIDVDGVDLAKDSEMYRQLRQRIWNAFQFRHLTNPLPCDIIYLVSMLNNC